MADAAPTAPAAAPAAPPAPPDTFDARVAAAKALARPGMPPAAQPPAPKGKAAAAAPEPAPEGDGAEPEPAAAPEPETPETAEGDDGEGEGDEGETDGGEDDSPAPTNDAERVAAALGAMEKGDVEATIKALGGDPKKINAPTRRAFRAHAQRQKLLARKEGQFKAELTRAQGEIAAESNRVSQLQRALANKFAPAEAVEKAWASQDALALGKALEKQLGASLVEITQMLASGKSGKTDAEKALSDKIAQLEREKAELEQKTRASEQTKTLAQKRETAVAKMGESLRSHPYLVAMDESGKKVMDPEARDEVFAAWEASWNGQKFTKTAQQCADELQAKLEARARARGLAKTAAPATPSKTAKPAANGKPAAGKTGKPAGKRMPEPPPVGGRRVSSPDDLEATRAMRLANAKRMTEMQLRGLRG